MCLVWIVGSKPCTREKFFCACAGHVGILRAGGKTESLSSGQEMYHSASESGGIRLSYENFSRTHMAVNHIVGVIP